MGLKNYNSGLAKLEHEEIRCCYVGVTRTKKSLVIFDPILQTKSHTFPLLGPTGYI
jgi:superfamily I DNA/RNA helicase